MAYYVDSENFKRLAMLKKNWNLERPKCQKKHLHKKKHHDPIKRGKKNHFTTDVDNDQYTLQSKHVVNKT